MASCTLDRLTEYLATEIFRVVQDRGPITLEDIAFELGAKWNIRLNDYPELFSVVDAALQSGLRAGLMNEQHRRFKVCRGHDHQQRRSYSAALSSSLIDLNKASNMKAAGSMNRKKVHWKPETLETECESEAEAVPKGGTFLDTLMNISRSIFNILT